MKAQLRTTKRGGAAALLIALLALGCLGRSPGVRQFTIGPVPGPTVTGSSPELVVTLGPLSFPPYLQRPQLVTRGDASELVYDERNRWAGGFESNVRRALADDLSERLGTPWVVFAASEAPHPVDYRVAIDFLRFEARPGDELVLRARWAIRGAGGERVWTGGGAIRRPLPDEDVESLVSAHEAALGQLADAIASPIGEARREAAGSPDA